MSGMNYELLKLSRILPSINGKPTLEIYKESLERARRNYQIQQERAQDPNYNEHEDSTEHIISAWDNEREGGSANRGQGNKNNNKRTLKEVRSAERVMINSNFDINLEEYQNLNALINTPIKEQGSMSLYRAVTKGKGKFKGRKLESKSKPAIETNTADGFFGTRPKVQIHSQHDNPILRPGSCYTPSNFVFRKKKAVLRIGSENESTYQYNAARDSIPEDVIGLSGLKMRMDKTNGDSMANLQKNYLKNIKSEIGLTFQERFARANGSAANIYSSNGLRSPVEERRVIQTAQATNLLARSSSRHTAAQYQSTSSSKMNTLMIDSALKITSPKKHNGFVPLGKARGFKATESDQVTLV